MRDGIDVRGSSPCGHRGADSIVAHTRSASIGWIGQNVAGWGSILVTSDDRACQVPALSHFGKRMPEVAAMLSVAAKAANTATTQGWIPVSDPGRNVRQIRERGTATPTRHAAPC